MKRLDGTSQHRTPRALRRSSALVVSLLLGVALALTAGLPAQASPQGVRVSTKAPTPADDSGTGTGEIDGTVTGPDGHPLADAHIEADDEDGDFIADAYTDGTGGYRITALAPGSYTVQLRNDGAYSGRVAYPSQWYGSAYEADDAQYFTVVNGTPTTGIDFDLSTEGSLSGTVTLAGPGDVTGVGVFIESSGSDLYALAAPGADGHYEAAGLPTGDYDVSFEYSYASDAYSYSAQYYNGVASRDDATPVHLVAGTPTTGINATLQQGGEIDGTVTLVNGGDAADNTEVDVYDATTGDAVYASTQFPDPSTGDYRLFNLAPGSYKLKFSDSTDGYIDTWYGGSDQASATAIVVTAGAVLTGKDVTLHPGATISGTITAPGADFSQFRVYAYDAVTGDDVQQASVDGSGNFAISGLVAGSYTIEINDFSDTYPDQWYASGGNVRSVDDATAVSVASSATHSGLAITMLRGQTISGTITLPAGGFVPDDYEVAVYHADGSFAAYADIEDSDWTNGVASYAVPGLFPGQYTVQFVGPGLVPVWYKAGTPGGTYAQADASPVTVASAAPTTGINLVYVGAGSITGTVHRYDGNALSENNVDIEVWRRDGTALATQAALGAGGTFRVYGLTAGVYNILVTSFNTAYAPTWATATVTAGSPTTVPTINVAASATIHGTLKNTAGVAIAGADVGLSPTDFSAQPAPVYCLSGCGGNNGAGIYNVTTDSQGRFTISGLPAGTFSLAAAVLGADGTMWTYYAAGSGGTPNQANATPLTLTAGETDPTSYNIVFGATSVTPVAPGSVSITGHAVAGGSAAYSPSGTVLTATTAGWASGVSLTYQWLRDGSKAIGTHSSYTVTTADVGHSLSVRVVGHRSGSPDSTAVTSARVAITAAKQPKLKLAVAGLKSGKGVVAVKLTASVPGRLHGSSVAYQWYRGTAKVAGAAGKAASYTPLASDQTGAKKIHVVATVTLAGYTGVTLTSPSYVIAKGTLKAAVPKIVGKAKVGATLKVSTGTWTKGVTKKIQWLAGGKAVKGATKSTFKLTAKQKGKKITVKVTGSLKGYTTVAKVSKASAKVAK